MRCEVTAFAQQMEDRLQHFDYDKGTKGWKESNPESLMDLLINKVNQLKKFVGTLEAYPPLPGSKRVALCELCADAANYAMMVSDCVNAIPIAQPSEVELENLKLREALKQARAQLVLLGTDGDEIQQAVLSVIAKALKG